MRAPALYDRPGGWRPDAAALGTDRENKPSISLDDYPSIAEPAGLDNRRCLSAGDALHDLPASSEVTEGRMGRSTAENYA